MQRLLVICALGLGLTLTQGCATQDLLFSTKPATSNAAGGREGYTPYQPERGTVRDGKSGASTAFGQGSPVPPTGYSTPPPSGYAAPPPGMPASHEPSKVSGSSNGSDAPKPVITTPSGLKEREL